jgi:predicted TIM-barrel fold metal-dependent hydrolase
MIVDCHCHAGAGDGFTAPADTRANLERYLRRAERAGIERTVLFAAFHSDYVLANREVAHMVSTRPDRFWGFAFVHAQADRGRIHVMVRTAVEEYGFRGLKVHRHDARITREVCEAARAFSLPVLYDPMGEVQSVELLASEYPDLAFIIPHLSSFAGDWGAQHAFVDTLARHANVFTDTSGVRNFDLLVEAVRRAGARKVLFGSDGPWIHPALELAKVRLLGLPPDQEQQVLGGNILRLLRADRAPAAHVGTGGARGEFASW